MSFSVEVKNEVSKIACEKSEYIAELSGFIINNANFLSNEFVLTTENASIARRIFSLIKDIYNIIPKITVRRSYNFNKKNLYILEYKRDNAILEDLGIEENGKELGLPKSFVASNQDDLMAFLRGVFLATGSINDPKKSRYHLEFFVKTKELAIYINDLLNEFELNSKHIKRNKGYMVYIKESEKISDFLRIIKAYQSILYYEDIRIYRDHVNMTNRLNNCEQANVEKTINSANDHIKNINIIKEYNGLDLLDEKTKIIIEYRLKYPESSLSELSEIINLETHVTITKSGLNHKMRKIKELAMKFSGGNNND